ncbi:MAG: hypothetical protein QME61_01465, partial [Patescibacteria group bacterium]|nr:hypothetical protein [Patescibacteria group bacterium]
MKLDGAGNLIVGGELTVEGATTTIRGQKYVWPSSKNDGYLKLTGDNLSWTSIDIPSPLWATSSAPDGKEILHPNSKFGYSTNSLVIRKSDGNVGIGTTEPQAKLDVNGGVRINTASAATRNATTVGFACLDLNKNNSTLGDDTCNESKRGMIKMSENTCKDEKKRDSLCYCGKYDDNWRWICLVSCPASE